MEYKSLFIGIAFSIAVFALKSGLGLHYLLSRGKALWPAVSILAAFAAGYFMLFGLTYWLLTSVNFLDHLQTAHIFFKSGMWIHFLMALLMTLWGVSLLKKRSREKHGLGWVAMLVPCPVCFSVILLSLSFSLAAFPDAGISVAAGLYGLFVAIAIIAAGGMSWLGKRLSLNPQTVLGAAMVIIAAYFILSVLVLPYFGQVNEIYRLASRAGDGPSPSHISLWAGWGSAALLFFIGFSRLRRKIRRQAAWISRHC